MTPWGERGAEQQQSFCKWHSLRYLLTSTLPPPSRCRQHSIRPCPALATLTPDSKQQQECQKQPSTLIHDGTREWNKAWIFSSWLCLWGCHPVLVPIFPSSPGTREKTISYFLAPTIPDPEPHGSRAGCGVNIQIPKNHSFLSVLQQGKMNMLRKKKSQFIYLTYASWMRERPDEN